MNLAEADNIDIDIDIDRYRYKYIIDRQTDRSAYQMHHVKADSARL